MLRFGWPRMREPRTIAGPLEMRNGGGPVAMRSKGDIPAPTSPVHEADLFMRDVAEIATIFLLVIFILALLATIYYKAFYP